MIDFKTFKEIFDHLDSNRSPEIELYFKDKREMYMLIKHKEGYISFGSCGKNGVNEKFSNLDKLYNTKTKEGILLKEDWDTIEDILIDTAFSVVENMEDIRKIYLSHEKW